MQMKLRSIFILNIYSLPILIRCINTISKEFTKPSYAMLRRTLFLSFLVLFIQQLSAQGDMSVQDNDIFTHNSETNTLNNNINPLKGSTNYLNHNTVSLRANLLGWAIFTPNLGAEWRITTNCSLQLNGSRTSWSWIIKPVTMVFGNSRSKSAFF